MGPSQPAALEGGALGLSLSQREVWLDQRAWPDSPHLNIGGGAFLVGALDVPRLQAALHRLVQENEALRLAPRLDGSQALLPEFTPRLEFVDLGTAEDPLTAIRQWWLAQIRVPFALDGTPPWRFALLRANDMLHGLTIQFHHLVMDGWGTSQVMRRWSELYNGTDGDAPPASAAPSYRAFIAESQAYRESAAFERDAAYWREQVPTLQPPLFERRHARHPTELPASRLAQQTVMRADYERLQQFAAERGSSPFNVLLAAIVLYFARVNQRREVVVGIPSLNRGGQRHKATLGMFVGVFALRVEVTPGMDGAALIAAIGAAMRGALRHARYPLSELGRTLQAIRSARDGLFDVMLSFERQDYALTFGEADLIDSRQLFSGTARYALGVTICEFHPDQDLELVLDGSAECFAEGDVELLGRRFWHLAQALMNAPQQRLEHLPVLPPEEHWALIEGLHKDVARHDAPQPFVALFEHQAALRPEATALVWGGGAMDYATLERRASLLAQRLAGAGVRRGDIVALALERSADLVAALLAAAKCGAAFLPLDADAPVARLGKLVHESGAAVLLVQQHQATRLAGLHERLLVVDGPMTATPAEAVPIEPARPGDAAYVLYTSGSTGQPKGVVVPHATLSRRLAWLSRSYAVDWRDRSAQATQPTFDPALIELLLPLIHGASVALPPPGRVAPESMAEFAAVHGVTIMAFVPATLARFLDAARGRGDLRLRVACCGGEVLAPDLAQRFTAQTGARLFNVYGPTEACIFATAWECESVPPGEALPIGQPVDDVRIYVLDAALEPVPFGVPGEIYIGGDSLARGYLNRPELDAEAFVDDPYRPGARLYRTGDRGWLGSEGKLYFIGRLDRQVKLRGYRIELGEIEAALQALPGVSHAAVRLAERQGKPQLQAWVAVAGAGSDASAEAAALLQRLRLQLPDYMVPAALRVLPALPLGASGKVDPDALPELDEPAVSGAATRGPTQRFEPELLRLWEQVLERPGLGVQDNFFDLGGDSLAALDLLTSVETLAERRVPMHFLAEHPTVERLAAALASDAGPHGLMIRLGDDAGRVPLYLAASGHGDLLRFQNLARALGPACELHMLQPPTTVPMPSIGELATLYADRIQAQGEVPPYLAGFSVGGLAALETCRVLQQRGVPVRGLFLIDTVFPRSFWARPKFWRLCGWIIRTLHVQELSMNGRRLGAMFNDPGLIGQVMALDGYEPAGFDGPTMLIKTSGLASWDRWLFRAWRQLLPPSQLLEHEVPGLHGSVFEAGNVGELAAVMAPRLLPAP